MFLGKHILVFDSKISGQAKDKHMYSSIHFLQNKFDKYHVFDLGHFPQGTHYFRSLATQFSERGSSYSLKSTLFWATTTRSKVYSIHVYLSVPNTLR